MQSRSPISSRLASATRAWFVLGALAAGLGCQAGANVVDGSAGSGGKVGLADAAGMLDIGQNGPRVADDTAPGPADHGAIAPDSAAAGPTHDAPSADAPADLGGPEQAIPDGPPALIPGDAALDATNVLAVNSGADSTERDAPEPAALDGATVDGYASVDAGAAFDGFCAAESCGASQCNAGFADCNGSLADGCEADLTRDASNCNACGALCPADHGTPICAGRDCTYAHLATAVNAQSVSNPGGTTRAPLGGSIQFTVRAPHAQPGSPAEVRYFLARNLVLQSAVCGTQIGACQPASFTDPLPNGVQGNTQILDCLLTDASQPLVITALASGSLAPRDDPFAALACFAPFASCDPVRVALQLPPGTVTTIGPQRTAVVLASASGAPAHPYANLSNTASIFFSPNNPQSARNFFVQSSYGTASAGSTVLVGGASAEGTTADIYGPFAVTTGSCMTATDVLAVAGPSINFANYDRIAISANDPIRCGGGGLTGPQTVSAGGQPKSIPTSINYNAAFGDTTLNGRIGSVLLHEFGHQLGLNHGGGWDCGASAQALNGRCTDIPYLDMTDVMGSGSYAQYAPVHKERLGWLEGGRILPVWSSGRYVVNAYEDAAENVKVLKLPRKWRRPSRTDPAGLTSGSYYIAARRPTAPWNNWLTTTPSFASGVAVYMDEGVANADAAILDPTPASASGTMDFYDGALLAGQTFTDAAAGISVTVVSVTATTATVDVTVQSRTTRFIQSGASDPYGSEVAGTSVLGTGNFTAGSNVTLTAVPPGGYGLAYWMSSSGGWLSADNPYTFELDDDTVIWATFRAVAPANDTFADAQPVTALPTHIALYTQSARTETGEPSNIPCGSQNVNPQATVWYSFTPASTRNVAIATRGSDYYTTIAVFTGSALNALTLVPGACGFDNAIQFAQATFTATAGTTYYIQIGAWNMGQNLVLDFTASP